MVVAGAENVEVAGEADLVRVCAGVAAGWDGDGDGEDRLEELEELSPFLSEEFTDKGRPLLCA